MAKNETVVVSEAEKRMEKLDALEDSLYENGADAFKDVKKLDLKPKELVADMRGVGFKYSRVRDNCYDMLTTLALLYCARTANDIFSGKKIKDEEISNFMVEWAKDHARSGAGSGADRRISDKATNFLR